MLVFVMALILEVGKLTDFASFGSIISNNPWFIISGWLVGFIAFIYAIITRKRKALQFSFRTNLLIDENQIGIEGLSVSFGGKSIKKLYVTKFEIQNNGNQYIQQKEDIYEDHTLSICSHDHCEIIYAQIMNESSDTIKSVINCDISERGFTDKVSIFFDTFEKDDAIIVNVYHTGSEDIRFYLDGKIRGGRISEITSTIDRHEETVLYISIFSSLLVLFVLNFYEVVLKMRFLFMGIIVIFLIAALGVLYIDSRKMISIIKACCKKRLFSKP